jgi:Ran GTPase-activating protein (RanGAP) involved in mRNA processing and transport
MNDSMLDYQAHITNFKRTKTQNDYGLRVLLLKRNKFSDGFAKLIAKTLFKDKYLKKIDVSGNFIREHAFSTIIKTGLIENTSIVCFDARINPGFSPKVHE